jgi:hypothetical protein
MEGLGSLTRGDGGTGRRAGPKPRWHRAVRVRSLLAALEIPSPAPTPGSRHPHGAARHIRGGTTALQPGHSDRYRRSDVLVLRRERCRP